MAAPLVKICCIKSATEAHTAIAHGAPAVCPVSHLPSRPGVIDETLIAGIAASVPPNPETFLLTTLTETAAISGQHNRCRTKTIAKTRRGESADTPLGDFVFPHLRVSAMRRSTGRPK